MKKLKNGLSLFLLVAIMPYVANAGIVRSINFEYNAGDGYYNIGDTVDVGPFVAYNAGGGNYASIVAANGGQALEIGQGGGSAVDFILTDPGNNQATEYFYDFQANFGQVTSSSSIFRTWISFVDSAGLKELTKFYIDRLTGELKLNGTNMAAAVNENQWYQIHFHLNPVLDELGHALSWDASVWIDGENVLNAENFTATSGVATKARYIKFQNYYNAGSAGATKTLYDNFNWATGDFVTPIPEPATFALLAIGGFALRKKNR